MTIRKLSFLFLLFSSFGLLLSPLLSFADDYSNNIGFIKNPPKELKDKFSMCDQFIDVKWIRQFPNGSWVGMVTADLYLGAKKERRELVVMQRHKPSRRRNDENRRIEIFDTKESSYREMKLESLILSADDVFSHYWAPYGHGFLLEINGELIRVSKTSLPSEARSFSYFKQNICVILPKSEWAWIIETNRPFLLESQMSIVEKDKFEQFKALAANECLRENMKDSFFCKDLTSGGKYARQAITLYISRDDNLNGYSWGRKIAFIGDRQAFFMETKKHCNYASDTGFTLYKQFDMQKEIDCISEEKHKFLLNRNNDSRLQHP